MSCTERLVAINVCPYILWIITKEFKINFIMECLAGVCVQEYATNNTSGNGSIHFSTYCNYNPLSQRK